jgi:hypothetical protein
MTCPQPNEHSIVIEHKIHHYDICGEYIDINTTSLA